MKIINKLLSSLILLLMIISFGGISFANTTTYTWSPLEVTIPTSATINSAENNNPLNLESGSAILIEQSTRSSTLFS